MSLSILTLAVVVIGCGTPPGPGASPLTTLSDEVAGGTETAIGTTLDLGSLDQQVPAPPSFREVVAMSDAVVLGTVVEVERGPNEGPPEFPEAQLATGRVTVNVSRVLSGAPKVTDDGTLFVAFGTGEPIASDEALSSLRSAMPKTEMLWVLTSIDRAYPGQSVFVLSNAATLVENVDGDARPLFFRATATEAIRGSLSTAKAQSALGPLVSDIARMDYESAIDVAQSVAPVKAGVPEAAAEQPSAEG